MAEAVVALISPMFTRLEEKLDLLFRKIDTLIEELAAARKRLDEAAAQARSGTGLAPGEHEGP